MGIETDSSLTMGLLGTSILLEGGGNGSGKMITAKNNEPEGRRRC
jgi:hypothetical protein